ncbi:MAG: hypothetical protein J2P48_08410 [Alphaproteobacteria bacterium]|nr:hypothetical protein [Alphaproteobacteria bacterium]
MRKAFASIPFSCLTAVLLMGCAGDVSNAQPSTAATPPAVAYNTATAARATPAAILVFLPTMGPVGAEDYLARDPALWAAQGFEVLTPQPAEIYRMVADQQAALARLVASAHAVANAPVWLVGSSPALDTLLETATPSGRGQISGVVVTSVGSPAISCSESFSYYDPGTGAPPQVKASRSGNCGPGVSIAVPQAGPPGVTGRQPPILQPPFRRPKAPRIIEASATGKNLPPAARVHRLAELIKASPSG